MKLNVIKVLLARLSDPTTDRDLKEEEDHRIGIYCITRKVSSVEAHPLSGVFELARNS